MGSPQDESHIQNSLTPTETIRLIRDEEKGVRGYGGGGRGKNIYLSLQCHHQNDSVFFCIIVYQQLIR